MNEPAPQSRRLIHFTPLRYPGGKGKLTAYIKNPMKRNRLLDGEYVEPYAGGSAIALELLSTNTSSKSTPTTSVARYMRFGRAF